MRKTLLLVIVFLYQEGKDLEHKNTPLPTMSLIIYYTHRYLQSFFSINPIPPSQADSVLVKYLPKYGRHVVGVLQRRQD